MGMGCQASETGDPNEYRVRSVVRRAPANPPPSPRGGGETVPTITRIDVGAAVRTSRMRGGSCVGAQIYPDSATLPIAPQSVPSRKNPRRSVSFPLSHRHPCLCRSLRHLRQPRNSFWLVRHHRTTLCTNVAATTTGGSRHSINAPSVTV